LCGSRISGSQRGTLSLRYPRPRVTGRSLGLESWCGRTSRVTFASADEQCGGSWHDRLCAWPTRSHTTHGNPLAHRGRPLDVREIAPKSIAGNRLLGGRRSPEGYQPFGRPLVSMLLVGGYGYETSLRLLASVPAEHWLRRWVRATRERRTRSDDRPLAPVPHREDRRRSGLHHPGGRRLLTGRARSPAGTEPNLFVVRGDKSGGETGPAPLRAGRRRHRARPIVGGSYGTHNNHRLRTRRAGPL
jgi:hypothetical protein